MIELKKEYDQFGLKMTLAGDWGYGSECRVNYPVIEEVIIDAQQKNIVPNFFYDARNLRYEMSNGILCLIKIPKIIYKVYCPITICAIDDKIYTRRPTSWKGFFLYGWRGIAPYFEAEEEACGKKILFFDYDEAFQSYKLAFDNYLY